jgi:hypothetical protein
MVGAEDVKGDILALESKGGEDSVNDSGILCAAKSEVNEENGLAKVAISELDDDADAGLAATGGVERLGVGVRL